MSDPETLAFYNRQAQDYADRFASLKSPGNDETAFLDALPATPRILDLGCGPGQAARAFMDAGARVVAMDASQGMIDIARSHGIDARLATFSDLSDTAAYDGVWASFSLLHAPRVDMPTHLAAIARALVPGGLFYMAVKTGTGAARDRLSRHYTFYSETELERLLADAGFSILTRRTGSAVGMEGSLAPYIALLSRRA